MDEIALFIKNWWAVISAFAGLAGLLWKWVAVPLQKVARKIDQNADAVATLQHDRLLQGHRYFVSKGWIPHDEKESLVIMFDQYKSTGHNHIYESYRNEIIKLPERPPYENGGRNND